MIKKIIIFILILFIASCNSVEFVIKNENQTNQLKNKTALLMSQDKEGRVASVLFSLLGNNQSNDFILKTSLVEKKENRIVKTNQVAEKIDYTLEVNYDLFYKSKECKIISKKIISKFSFTPKSGGYNFGADRSFEKLYLNSIKENVETFLGLAPFETSCS